MFLDTLKPYAKAVAAFVVPAAGSLVAAMQDGTPDGSAISASEWLAALIIGVTSSGFVYGTPNKDPQGLKQAESVQPPEVERGGFWGGIRPKPNAPYSGSSKPDAAYHDGGD